MYSTINDLFPHPDKWRVFRSPPDAPVRVFSFESEAGARKALAGLRLHGHGEYCFIVPPEGGAAGLSTLLFCIFGLPALLLGLMFLLAIELDRAACSSVWAESGFVSRYTVLGGCQISKDSKRWIPADAYRQTEGT